MDPRNKSGDDKRDYPALTPGPRARYTRAMFDSYIICGTPRTGSTFFAICWLRRSAPASPDSFYGRKFMPDWAAAWHLPDPSTMTERDYAITYLDAAIRVGKAGTPIFGLRLMRENLDELSDPARPDLSRPSFR